MQKLIFTLILTMTAFMVNAQNEEMINIPLTSPGQPGTLEVRLHDGTATIEGYNGSEIVLKITSGKDKDKGSSKSGLRRIPNTSLDVSITEEDNHVNISGSHSKRSDFIIQVPKNFNLSIKTHHNGQIKISNINGEIEAKGHHGGIELNEISGSVIAETHHGRISATFDAVDSSKPMGFSTYHGDVDITFPASTKGSLKMKTTKGEILTDFDMSIEKPKIERKSSGGRNEIKLSGWTQGNIGGGGEEYLFTTYHGSILIRKG